MISKAIRIYVLIAFAAVVLYACTCKPDGDYLTITDGYIGIYTSNEQWIGDTIYLRDTLKFSYNLRSNCVATNQNFPTLINSAMATSIHCACGKKGFRNPVTDFKIYTDSAYGPYAAGAEITSLFTGYDYSGSGYSGNTGDYTYYASNNFVARLNGGSHGDNGMGDVAIALLLTQKPGDTLWHSFSFHTITSDTIIKTRTDPFRWK